MNRHSNDKADIRVRAHPAKPLMIYDGDCNFCKFWILRWQRIVADRVEFMPSQDPRVAEQFPEIPRERFDESVQFIEPDGRVFSGAEAVFRALAKRPLFALPLAIYEGMPGVAPAAEWAYAFVAQNRQLSSSLTRFFWGLNGALPEFKLSSWVFLRFLGLIYLIAFVSLGSQIMGLIGSHGILPVAPWLDSVRQIADQRHVGIERYHAYPTLCWLNASDGFLKFQVIAGVVLSLLVVINIAPAPCLFLLWLIYLSLSVVCREFLGFQWDTLLLETGFLAIFLAPFELWPRLRQARSPSRIARWLLWWLLARLMFESGMVKLLSGDPTWRNLTALNYHYETQPLPTWIGWYAHHLPDSVQKICVLLMFIIELGCPFLIFGPRRVRFTAAGLLILLQIIIFLTGNYCFFNLLTIAMCLLLLDDAALARFVPKRWRKGVAGSLPGHSVGEKTGSLSAEVRSADSQTTKTPEPASEFPKKSDLIRARRGGWPRWVTVPISIVILMVTGSQILGMIGVIESYPWPVDKLYEKIYPFRSVNTYGLFAMMTTSRLEIVIEGSNDGRNWKSYEFKYKPGDLKRRPAFVAPHQPRLDWQMWFAALGDIRQNAWLGSCCLRILQGTPEVLALFGRNPFPNTPPHYVRALIYEYHFTSFKERRATGDWWKRQLKGEYMRPITLRSNSDRNGIGQPGKP